MAIDLRQKKQALAQAGARLAVSEAVAAELRAADIGPVEVIPNVVDPEEVRALAVPEASFPLPERFLLFVGKLEENKGARALVPAVAASRTGLPLVVLGEGSLSHALKFEAASASVPVILRGWAHRDDVLRAMARATAIVFPSLWPEPLSRVLLEALALGTPVAAMATGGTREILIDGESGLVVAEATALGEAVARLVGDPALRETIAAGARVRSRAFAPETLVPRYEAVYRRLA
jgi:glycosyltransferase involved in cell wall biosynthesis